MPLYYVGESIELRFMVWYRGETPETIRVKRDTSTGLVCIIRRDETFVSAHLISKSVILVTPERSRPVTLTPGSVLTFEPHAIFFVDLGFERPLTPGRYGVSCKHDMLDVPYDAGDDNAGVFNFDVRHPTTDDDRLEVARRRADRAFVGSDLKAARAGTDEMLRIAPTSAFAYALRGAIAEAEGNLAQARRDYAEALRIIEHNLDERWFRTVSQFELDYTRKSFTTRLRELGQR